MRSAKNDEIRRAVRKSYTEVAKTAGPGCGCECGCGPEDNRTAEDMSLALGYSKDDVSGVPEGSNMGLGCGNPQAIASLHSGETVLDLGSGGGFDCFLAAKAVGQTGHVIGVDMTPDMIGKAREDTARTGLPNVEFRLGEIENLPVADNVVDVVISNCVINLSPEKQKVYNEAYRVLKPGGRLAISDVVATSELPEEVKEDLTLHAGCVAGAAQIDELKAMLAEAGFTNIRIEPKDGSEKLIDEWLSGKRIGDLVTSASIEAVKP